MCMGSQYLSVTHVYIDTQSHKCVQMVEFSGEYGNTWVFGTLGLRYPWILGTLVLTVPLDLRTLGCSELWYLWIVGVVISSAFLKKIPM